jgi:protein SCO1/2
MAGVVLAACSSGSAPPAPGPSEGVVLHRAVPAAISSIPLHDQHGATLTLASLHGKTVMLVPFMTLCTDVCPMTTANVSLVHRSLDHAGLGSKVALIELSVDPGRDDRARLAAYARLTGSTWALVTESPADLARMAKFFGIYYQRVPEGNPPTVDWLTHRPLTYDVAHSDGYVVIDPSGHVRFATAAAPGYRGQLDPTLHAFLDTQGRAHLAHPDQPNWTAAEALGVLGWSLKTTVPVSG